MTVHEERPKASHTYELCEGPVFWMFIPIPQWILIMKTEQCNNLKHGEY